MRLRCHRMLIAASALAASAGCEKPEDVVPVTPPGYAAKLPEVPEGQGAQALGEAANLRPQTKQKTVPKNTANSPPTPIGQPATTPSGLAYETLKEGTGATCKSGDEVAMNYVGTLENGTKFESSYDSGRPISFTIGAGGVIPGWDEGVPGMKVGEKRKLIIPAKLAYGGQDKGKIPPNSTLLFEVELMSISK